MLPQFVVIGAQKSGSTFVLRALGEHPKVYMPPAEVRFFEDPDYGDGDPAPLEALFEDAPPGAVRGIKRPGYLARPEVAARIHRHVPDARLIAILRNPIDRAVSAYFHLMRTGFIPIRSLEDGLARILDGQYRSAHVKAAEIVEFGLYHEHLSRYLDLFDRQQLLVILFDDLRSRPHDAVRQAYRFIGVDDSHQPAALARDRAVNPNPGMYSLPRLRVNAVGASFRYRYDERRTRRWTRARRTPVQRAVTRAAETLDRHVLSRVFPADRPEPSPALRRRLVELYAPDVERLEALLDRSLAHWLEPLPESADGT
jgi:hypothetical protein